MSQMYIMMHLEWVRALAGSWIVPSDQELGSRSPVKFGLLARFFRTEDHN